MLRSLLIGLTLLAQPAYSLCGGASFAERLTEAEQTEIAAKRASTPYSHGTTWTARQGDSLIHIIGTMHLRDPRLLPLMNELRSDISSADLILLEATPDEEKQVMAYMTSNPDLLFSTTGPTLPEELSEATWQSLADAARARGIPPILAAKMQPWYLMMTLGVPVCAMADLAANKRGLDQMIIEQAQADGIPMQALEPYDTIFSILQDGTRAEQIEMLEVALIDPMQQQEVFVAMLDSYFDEDIVSILKVSEIATRHSVNLPADQIAKLTAEAEQAMLYDRNIRWIPVIEQAAKTNETLVVAVGAGHLPGELGVLKLLENNGWTLSPR